MKEQVLITDVSFDDFISALAEKMSIEHRKTKSYEFEQLDQELIKIPEVAKILQVSEVTVHSWKKAGKIPFYLISNRVYFKKNEVISALKKNEINGTNIEVLK